jgi:hypothetical protein
LLAAVAMRSSVSSPPLPELPKRSSSSDIVTKGEVVLIWQVPLM